MSSIFKVDATTSEHRVTGRARGSRSTRGHQQTSLLPTVPIASSSKGKADTIDFVTAQPHIQNATGSALLPNTQYSGKTPSQDIVSLVYRSSAFSSSHIQTTPPTISVNKKELKPSNQTTNIVIFIVGVVIILIRAVVSVSFIIRKRRKMFAEASEDDCIKQPSAPYAVQLRNIGGEVAADPSTSERRNSLFTERETSCTTTSTPCTEQYARIGASPAQAENPRHKSPAPEQTRSQLPKDRSCEQARDIYAKPMKSQSCYADGLPQHHTADSQIETAKHVSINKAGTQEIEIPPPYQLAKMNPTLKASEMLTTIPSGGSLPDGRESARQVVSEACPNRNEAYERSLCSLPSDVEAQMNHVHSTTAASGDDRESRSGTDKVVQYTVPDKPSAKASAIPKSSKNYACKQLAFKPGLVTQVTGNTHNANIHLPAAGRDIYSVVNKTSLTQTPRG